MAKLGLLNKIVGNANEKELARLRKITEQIEAHQDNIATLNNSELAEKTAEFRQRLAEEPIDQLIPETFAVVREAAWRQMEQRLYPVQLIGGVVLHEGKIAEMKTGEGKTLTAIAPLYLNALSGKGAHLVTVNDYLARRDATWYGPVFSSLGLTVGVIQGDHQQFMYDPEANEIGDTYTNLRKCERWEAYAADITYGTNNEFGFDYLRDNMAKDSSTRIQGELNFVIVDEVDNILIDEARTPLIISGQAEEASGTYQRFARAVRGLTPETDYQVDQKAKHVALSEIGIGKVEKHLGVENIFGEDPKLAQHLEAALDAEYLKRRDRDYVVQNGGIVIVDEFTGRMMEGRRWSHGIHQAVEAKESVKIQRESLTHATITFQNYFRLYQKIAGMTGTAETEAEEFAKIYSLDVVAIPTNQPMVRLDDEDLVYINEEAKFSAVVEDIEERNKKGQPILVGTTSIEKSEYVAELLKRRGIQHSILNAKQHEKEAQIIEHAGKLGSVTIATNMAGRGTDIKLENESVKAGGLHVIGTERHESRRIDNQLRGRSGRQGDPGSSRFFVSFGDDIMKRFAPDWVPGMMQKIGMTNDMPLESGMVTKAIEQAQQKVEGHNFDIRTRLVEFYDVMNEQRSIIYEERNKVLEGTNISENVLTFITKEVDAIVSRGSGDSEYIHTQLHEVMPEEDALAITEIDDLGASAADEALNRLEDKYEKLSQQAGGELFNSIQNWLILDVIDYHWQQHLTAMDEMRQSVGLQAYAQVDPLVAFKREGFDMFQQLQENIQHQIVQSIFRIKPGKMREAAQIRQSQPVQQTTRTNREIDQTTNGSVAIKQKAKEGDPASLLGKKQKVGRNDPCPCGSNKKFKKCHGSVQ